MRGFYYLHENGSLIWKPQLVVQNDPDYFDSPFVRRVWEIETDERLEGWRLLVEAAAAGARIQRILELAATWKCTIVDLPEYLVRETDINDERRSGLRRLIVAWKLDAEAVLDHIAATPAGTKPDMSRFVL